MSTAIVYSKSHREHGIDDLMWTLRSILAQDPSNKKIINCDPALQGVFGVSELTFSSVAKALALHLTSTSATTGIQCEAWPKTYGNDWN